MIKHIHEKEQAVRFRVDIEGDTQQYAMSLLHIINNARENGHIFYKVENTPSNIVKVTCNKEYADSVRDYLGSFGKIEEEEPIIKHTIYLELDQKSFEEIYGEGKQDAEFYIEVE